MTKRMSKVSKSKQKGGADLSTSPKPEVPAAAQGEGEWKWVPYNPTGIGQASGMFQKAVDKAAEKGMKMSKLARLSMMIGLVIFVFSIAGLTEKSVFAGVPWSPMSLIGLPIVLFLFFLPSFTDAALKMNASGNYKGILSKLWWFLTGPYFFVLALIGSLGVVCAQLAGFMVTKGAANVKDKLLNKMPNVWRGLWGMNVVNVILFLFFMYSYPFRPHITDSRGRKIILYDNIHAKGIMFNLLLVSLFFTIYFTVEFNTKFNVI